MVPRDRIHANLGIEPRQRVAKRADIAPHRVGSGKIIAGEKHELRLLAIDDIDREFEPLDVLIHVEMEVADLAGNHALERGG